MNVNQYSTALAILLAIRQFDHSLPENVISLTGDYHIRDNKRIPFDYPSWIKDWKATYAELSRTIASVKKFKYTEEAKVLFPEYVDWQASHNVIKHNLGILATHLLELRHNMKMWNKMKGFQK